MTCPDCARLAEGLRDEHTRTEERLQAIERRLLDVYSALLNHQRWVDGLAALVIPAEEP